MKDLKVYIVLAVSLFMVSGAYANDNDDGFGVGIIVGEPTGLSLKNWLSRTQAVDAGIAWSFSENDSLHLHADYLWHSFDVFKMNASTGKLPVYFGLGARAKFKDDNNGRGRNNNDDLIGIRFPLGISFMPAELPIDLFAEIVPILDLTPSSDFDINGAIGVRYFF